MRGSIAEILVAEGETVDVGTLLAVIAPAGSAVAEPAAAPAAPAPEPIAPAAVSEPVTPPTPVAEPQAQPAATGNGRTFVSPVVARIAAEQGVDPSAVTGTGTGGRVTKKDILAFIEGGAQPAVSASCGFSTCRTRTDGSARHGRQACSART